MAGRPASSDWIETLDGISVLPLVVALAGLALVIAGVLLFAHTLGSVGWAPPALVHPSSSPPAGVTGLPH